MTIQLIPIVMCLYIHVIILLFWCQCQYCHQCIIQTRFNKTIPSFCVHVDVCFPTVSLCYVTGQHLCFRNHPLQGATKPCTFSQEFMPLSAWWHRMLRSNRICKVVKTFIGVVLRHRESTEGYSNWKVEKRPDKLGKLVSTIGVYNKQVQKRDPTSCPEE